MGGAMPLDLAAAHAAAAPFAERLGLSVEAAAAGVVAVTNSSLATAIQLSLFEKGLDPEDFALLSFGGAGGVHACDVADELGIRRVVFPAHASTLSAWGILWSDIVHDLAATVIAPLAEAGPALTERAARLAADAAALLGEDGVPEAQRRLGWTLDLRYAGQAFDLPVPLAAADFSAAGLAAAAAGFHAVHRRRFSYDEPKVAVEVVALRLAATGALAKPMPAPPDAPAAASAPRWRPVHHRQGFLDTSVIDRAGLVPGLTIDGPAVIEEAYTSTYLPPGWRLAAGAGGALIAERTGEPS
jgi:N-methylhydantoinase A